MSSFYVSFVIKHIADGFVFICYPAKCWHRVWSVLIQVRFGLPAGCLISAFFSIAIVDIASLLLPIILPRGTSVLPAFRRQPFVELLIIVNVAHHIR